MDIFFNKAPSPSPIQHGFETNIQLPFTKWLYIPIKIKFKCETSILRQSMEIWNWSGAKNLSFFFFIKMNMLKRNNPTWCHYSFYFRILSIVRKIFLSILMYVCHSGLLKKCTKSVKNCWKPIPNINFSWLGYNIGIHFTVSQTASKSSI